MAKGINKVILVGNLGAEPEVRFSANGTAVTRIRVATTETWKDKQTGEVQERTEWHRVTFFGRTAEVAGEYLKKGSQVYIEGKLQTSTYEKEGQTHYSTDIIAHEMQMLGSRGGESGNGNGARQGSFGGNDNQRGGNAGRNGGQPQRQQQPQQQFDDSFDDIPF